MARDIKHLPEDLEILLGDAIGASASEIHFTLQYVSPWWTGSFNRAWDIHTSPIQPGLRRETSVPRYEGAAGVPGRVPRKAPQYTPAPYSILGKPLYIGNMIEYAGFAVNKPGATMPSMDGTPVTYAEHAQLANEITPRPPVADWFWIYLQHGRARYLMRDIDKGFNKAGFTVGFSKVFNAGGKSDYRATAM
jgi:hypothetical protein